MRRVGLPVMDATILLLVFLVVLSGISIRSRIAAADRRVARVERKLDLVLEHLGLREEIPRLDEIVALVREGKTVQAVKVYREATGADLVEAKQAVDRLG
ncbi:hypothetical protein DKG34_32010 [Streptomyces sp. NWU49]|uniref:Ribosomal protein L7/L12 C-terminal domain-containing protein n=2 Tax=Streptomyces TaxID=1883 RepID=A0ABX6AHV1_STRVD|nr:hypothetical protein DKG34_32010 [Streptomyces sp. NWU49]QEU86780.1 hypothetical protein CP969_20390 [Streptomyces viridosporus T7A]